MRFFVIATVLSAACAVNAVNITVNVSDPQDTPKFTNNSVTAAKGDFIIFKFQGGNNTVTQSENFDHPCKHLEGGFASGFRADGQFVVKVNNTEPIWYHCSQVGHCQFGMVGVINPPKNETIEDFQKIAASGTPTTSPVKVTSSPVKVTSSPIKVTSSPVKVTPSPVNAASSPAATSAW